MVKSNSILKSTGLVGSEFYHYGFGILTEDKKRDVNIIKVFPIEHMGTYSGKLDELKVIKYMTTNELEDPILKSVVVDHTVDATWLPIGQSNRYGSPDVCRGETVSLYKYGDSNVIFWDTMFNEDDLRKKEHLSFGCSNTDDITESLNEKNTYYNSMDTRKKFVKVIHTSDNDGELTTYDIDIDPVEGVLNIYDGRGNYIRLESELDQITIETNEVVNIKTKVVNVDCEDYNLTCNNYTLKSDVASVTADSSHSLKTSSNSVKADTNTIKGATTIDGATTITPPLPTGSTVAKT
jgi:hypothetical protein